MFVNQVKSKNYNDFRKPGGNTLINYNEHEQRSRIKERKSVWVYYSAKIIKW